MGSLWEKLPQEILFHVVQNLPLSDIASFSSAFPEHSEFEDFWKAYSSHRRHFKKPETCTHKKWAFQMETNVVSQVVQGSANRAFSVNCSDSVFSLRRKLLRVLSEGTLSSPLKTTKDCTTRNKHLLSLCG
nr:hypothetical protein [Marseillevirus cajuinensis]